MQDINSRNDENGTDDLSSGYTSLSDGTTMVWRSKLWMDILVSRLVY